MGDNSLIKSRRQKFEFSGSKEARNNKAEFHRGKSLADSQGSLHRVFFEFLLNVKLHMCSVKLLKSAQRTNKEH